MPNWMPTGPGGSVRLALGEWAATARVAATHPHRPAAGDPDRPVAQPPADPRGPGEPVGCTVLALIRDRIAGRSGDGHRLGLAVEGGGMRGIVSAAMLLALRDLQAVDVFDACYGTSSGAVNLAYLFGGAGWDAMPVYYDHLTAGFLRHDRWNVTRPLLDMHYAFDSVIGDLVPIRWDRVRSADRPVYAVLTDVDRVDSRIADLRGVGDDGLAYLEAASWLPVLAGPPLVVAGTRYLDGGVLCPDPVYAAISDGCTDVLLLNTSPQGVWPSSPHSRPMLRPILDRWQAGLGEAYLRSRERWDADRATARYGCDVAMGACTVLRVAAPEGSHRVERLTMRRDVLLDGARAGYHAVLDLFGRHAMPYFALTTR